MALDRIEQRKIVNDVMADIEKVWFEEQVRRTAVQVYENGESIKDMKETLYRIAVKRRVRLTR